MIGKVAPIMTFEMLMRKYFDDLGRAPMEVDSKSLEDEQPHTVVLPDEQKMEEATSDQISRANDSIN